MGGRGYFDRIAARVVETESETPPLAPVRRFVMDPSAEVPTSTNPVEATEHSLYETPLMFEPELMQTPAPIAEVDSPNPLLSVAQDNTPREGLNVLPEAPDLEVAETSPPDFPVKEVLMPESGELLQEIRTEGVDHVERPAPVLEAPAPIQPPDQPPQPEPTVRREPEVTATGDRAESPTAPFERFIEQVVASEPAQATPIEPLAAPELPEAPVAAAAPRLEIGEISVEVIDTKKHSQRPTPQRIRRATGSGGLPNRRFGLGQL